MVAPSASLIVFLVAALPALSSPAAATKDALAIRCDRTGGFYVVGERASFTVTGGANQLSVEVRDYYRRKVIERQIPAANGESTPVAVDAAQLPRLGWHKITVTAGNHSASTTFAVVPPAGNRVPPEESPFGAIVSASLKADQVPDFARSLKLAGVRSPRWCTVEYRTMADQLAGATFVREVRPGKDLSGFHFRRQKQNGLVAWSDTASYEATIHLSARQDLVVTDIMGNSRKIAVVDGAASVTISYQPIFIGGLEADFEIE